MWQHYGCIAETHLSRFSADAGRLQNIPGSFHLLNSFRPLLPYGMTMAERCFPYANFSNFSELDYLRCLFGPATMDSAITNTIVYSLLFFTGLVGNIATAITIIKDVRLHTATNFYLYGNTVLVCHNTLASTLFIAGSLWPLRIFLSLL